MHLEAVWVRQWPDSTGRSQKIGAAGQDGLRRSFGMHDGTVGVGVHTRHALEMRLEAEQTSTASIPDAGIGRQAQQGELSGVTAAGRLPRRRCLRGGACAVVQAAAAVASSRARGSSRAAVAS